ncbi:MAG: ATP-dependent helicase [Chloroflexi bacterium]|uniref:ATP-dependent helicase n=1 Tax=Candidatus Flexifilum breve TaxID=3140694 RepID=UPI003134BB37|nr:ATP-dependent helicase [Chloroflexota bacterium]
MATFKPRPKQAEVLAYTSGKMGVSAVPGSGKTKTLSALAAKLIAEQLEDDEEVLIVTLVNSAVDNFARQIGAFVRERGLLPNVGYRVRTLHGLCNDIVRERPGLVGLADDFQIIDEREADTVLQDAALTWVKLHPEAAGQFLAGDLEDNRREWVTRERWTPLVTDIARAFVRQAKDERLSPDEIRRRLDLYKQPLPLAEMGYSIYVSYQRGLNMRGAVDFQDLIRLALLALELDDTFLARLRRRWRYILEDEAQDSSRLQELIIRQLAGKDGNWVRVGDPNQSIYETFTTAKPEYLRDFLREPGVSPRELPNSGRSALPIIELANHLITWTMDKHPNADVRDRDPLLPPLIQPAPPGDPQPNPPADQSKVVLYPAALPPAEELRAVVDSIRQWLPAHPDQTAAILVPRNKRGFDIVDALKREREPQIEYVELLRSTTSTREAAGAVGNILQYLSNPGDVRLLARVYQVWRRADRDDDALAARLENTVKALRKCPRVEDFITPQLGRDWLADDENVAKLIEADPEIGALLTEFRGIVRRWQEAVILPIDQLILILAQDLFQSAADLAIAHSMAVLLAGYAESHPAARLPEYTEELAVIARNERRFLGVDDADRGFDPEAHKGKVTVATMHAAKGLEWDRVYLLSVNTYDFPSALPGDQFMSEKRFIREGLNLEAEALGQLIALAHNLPYREGVATADARVDYAAERLRLLYVGITRARRELVMTWNTGQQGDQQMAVPFAALQAYLEERSK